MSQLASLARSRAILSLREIWRKHQLVFRLVIMASLLVIEVSRINVTNFERVLQSVKLLPLLMSVGFVYVAWLVNSYKWQRLLQAAGTKRSVGELFQLNLIAVFYGLALPGQLSGEVIKAIRLGERSERRGVVYASVWLDRLTGLVGLVVIGLAGLGIGPWPARPFWGLDLILAGLAGVLVLCSVVLVLPKIQVADIGKGPLDGQLTILARLEAWRQRLIASTGLDLSVGSICVAIALATAFQALNVMANWSSSLALGLSISPLTLGWVIPVFALLQLLPISIGGIGVRDVTFVTLLGLYNVAVQQALALSLIALGQLVLLGVTGWVLDLGILRWMTRLTSVDVTPQ